MSKLKNNSLIENAFSYLGTFIENCQLELLNYESANDHNKGIILLMI